MGVEGTMAGLVLDLAEEDRPGILHADQTLTHKEAVAAAARRGAWLRSIRRPGPFHVAVLSDNTVDYLWWAPPSSVETPRTEATSLLETSPTPSARS